MSSDQRTSLRIALSFTAAFVAAEALDIHMSFIAALFAGVLAAGPALAFRKLATLPILMWAIVASVGLAVQGLEQSPLVLCVLLLAVFYVGFQLCAQPGNESLGLIVLAGYAILPDLFVMAPELAADAARWSATNIALACLSVFVMARILPPAAYLGKQDDPVLTTVIHPFPAAVALLAAVLLTIAFQMPASGAILIGVILALRADAGGATYLVKNRILAMVFGGAAAVAVWELIGFAPNIMTVAFATLCASWIFASRIGSDPENRDLAVKSLNALAILLGKGFSFAFEDTDDLFWTRFGGVLIGLAYACIVIALVARKPTSPRSIAGSPTGQEASQPG